MGAAKRAISSNDSNPPAAKGPAPRGEPGKKRRPIKLVKPVVKSNGNGNGHSNGNGHDPTGPLPPTKLSDAELQSYRQILLDKRCQLTGDVTHMEDEALRRTRSDATGDLSMMPIHMADIGTDNYEQEFTIGLIQNEREMLKEIDEALARIEARTYGICLGTHKPLSKARLSAKPWARYCVEYMRSQEQSRRH
jgi:DnaK suppressor protein